MHWCNELSHLIDLIAYFVVYGPNSFPTEDELHLQSAVAELRRGLDSASGDIDPTTAESARRLLNDSETLYLKGEVNEGAWKLQDMSQLLDRCL